MGLSLARVPRVVRLRKTQVPRGHAAGSRLFARVPDQSAAADSDRLVVAEVAVCALEARTRRAVRGRGRDAVRGVRARAFGDPGSVDLDRTHALHFSDWELWSLQLDPERRGGVLVRSPDRARFVAGIAGHTGRRSVRGSHAGRADGASVR